MSFLQNLPSSGYFIHGANLEQGQLANYVCTHETNPPSHQQITTDDTDPLIRALRKRQKAKQNLKRPREIDSNPRQVKKRKIGV